MNKRELATLIAQKGNCTKKDADMILSAFCAVLTEKLTEGEPVQLVGIGTFSVRNRAPRMARNPRTGAAIQLPAARIPVFKPGKMLRDSVNRRVEKIDCVNA